MTLHPSVWRTKGCGSHFWFRQADHHVTGEFDAFGQFRGRVQVYGGDAVEYLLPWPQAAGRPLSCGPFSINFGYVQGEPRATKLAPEEHARLIAKLNRIGGLYIYRDGIRILPYGNSDYDFLNIEQRRTKSAGYYFFSYRRIFGVIDITRAGNPNLVEKAGREGFRENAAYRQLKRLLEHFFVHLAAEFFREGGYQADNFLATRADLEHKDKLRKQRARQVKIRRNAFGQELDAFFEAANARVPETSVDSVLAQADERFASLSSPARGDDVSQLFLDLETETRHELTTIDNHHRVVRPRGFGLTRQLQRDWDAYRLERHRLEENIFRPASARLDEIVTRHATRVRADLDDRRRLGRALEDTSESQRKRTGSLQREARDELTQLHGRVLARTRTGLTALEEAIRQTVIDFESTDTDELKRKDFDRVRANFEERILSVADAQSEQLEKLREQLKSVATTDGADPVELTDALEEELEALREREAAGLELAQVGMALGIVHHEFSSTINGIRNSIRQLKRWADANRSLQHLYGEIRANFDHLDGYLTLFTPLDRRLQRHQVEITGSDIHTFLANLFGDRLRRHHVDLRATPRFLAASVFGFPSSFYPCFVNLVDNAVFWLASRRDATIPYYTEGHDALLESARALAGMADLPAHALEAAGEVIADAKACKRRRAEIVALRAEATQLLEKRGEMEAALSEVPEDQLVPYTRDADYADWSARCGAAAERWQAMRGDADTWDPHLDRLGVGKAALEADLDRLGELRGHDEAWAALCVMHGGIAERARAEGKATFDLPEWNELADKAEALLARPGLPEAAARGARAILDYDRCCREVDAFLASAETHGARWDALRAEAATGENVSIVDLPGYAPLTEAERALRETGEAILADRTGTQLTRMQDGAALVTAALERLESHALLDRCVAAMNGLMESAGGAWASLPGDPLDETVEDAEALAKERGLEDEARRRLEAAIEEQAALLAQLAAIRQLLRDMEALDRHEQEFGESAARYEELPRSLVPGWEDFRAAHEAFPEAARPPLDDAAFEEFRQARPDLVDQIREAVGTARDRLALAASELDLDTAMGWAGYMEEAGAWQLDADDFTNACGRDAVKGDLVCFSVGADSLPGGDGEEREVRVIAELVTRSAKMSDLDDPCTLETLWRSDGGPTGQITVPLGTLAGDGCTRAVRGPGDDDEAARSWAVDEQAWELEAARRELLEAIRRERHLSMSMKM